MSESQSKWFQDEREILDEAISLRITVEGLVHSLYEAQTMADVRTASLMAIFDLDRPGSVEWPVGDLPDPEYVRQNQ